MSAELLAPPVFLESILTGLVVGGSNAALLAVLFRVTRLRSPQLRRVFMTFALLHVVLSVAGLFPLSWIQIGLLHEPTSWLAPWVPLLDRAALVVAIGVALLFTVRHVRRERRGRAILEGWMTLSGSDGDPELTRRLHEAISRIDPRGTTSVKIAVVPLAVTPCVIGSRTPIFIAPAPLFDRLNDDELAAVVAHEWAHLLSADTHVRRVLACLTILFWFDPFVRRFAHGIQLEGEKVRDARAVSQCGRRALGQALLKTFDLLSGFTHTPAIGCSPWIGRGFRSVRSRLRALAAPPVSRFVLCGQILAVCCFLPMPTLPAIAKASRTPAVHANDPATRPSTTPSSAMMIRPVPQIGSVGESCSISIGLRTPNPWLSRAAFRLLRSVGLSPRSLGTHDRDSQDSAGPEEASTFVPTSTTTPRK
ncbi:MAG: M56 family metallopeptidase [Planctomycetota bacterium]